MSLDKTNLMCSGCHAYLFEEDDVVYCPQCGAPHHRECYNALGHCALEDLHGTENQYDLVREKARKEKENEEKPTDRSSYNNTNFNSNINSDTSRCANCGNEFPSIMQRCPKCGNRNSQSQNVPPNIPGVHFIAFDPLGGIPADMELGKGVTADEAKKFVFSNTHRYIPKFAAMTAGKKASFNWLAFLFPNAWYLSRKMYLQGILSTLFLVALKLLTLPFATAAYSIDTSEAKSYFEITNILVQNLDVIGKIPLILAFVGSIINIIYCILTAVFCDYSYRNHTLNSVLEIKKLDKSEQDSAFRKKGGTSFLGLMLGFLAVQYLPTLIFMFL